MKEKCNISDISDLDEFKDLECNKYYSSKAIKNFAKY